MCEPVSITLAVVAAASAAFQGYSAMQAAKQQKKTAQNNAKIADMQAQDALERGRVEELRYRGQVEAHRAKQLNAFAKSGVTLDSGSVIDTLGDTAALGERDALAIRDNAAREAFGYEAQGYNFRMDAKAADMTAKANNPWVAAGSSLISSAAGNSAGIKNAWGNRSFFSSGDSAPLSSSGIGGIY